MTDATVNLQLLYSQYFRETGQTILVQFGPKVAHNETMMWSNFHQLF